MKLSEAIILGRSLVGQGKAGDWRTCALGGAHKAVTGETARGCGNLCRSFPGIFDTIVEYQNRKFTIGELTYYLYDNYVSCGLIPIEKVADIIRKCGDLDSADNSSTGTANAEGSSQNSPTPTLSTVR